MVGKAIESKISPKITVVTSTILNMDNDTSAFERVKNHDKQAFEMLFKKYYLRLCHFAFQYANSMSDAEELVQELFVSIWENRSTIQISTSFKSYLYQSVKNRGLNTVRNKKRRNAHLQILEKPSEQPSAADRNIAVKDINERLFNALELLPPKCQRIFQMSRLEGLKHKEIAEKMNIKEKTVENQIGIALRKLKKHFADYLKIMVLFISSTNI